MRCKRGQTDFSIVMKPAVDKLTWQRRLAYFPSWKFSLSDISPPDRPTEADSDQMKISIENLVVDG